MKTNKGIDYSLGRGDNTDPKTGIRYGIIPRNCLADWTMEEFDIDYPVPVCQCGQELDLLEHEECPDCGEETEGVMESMESTGESYQKNGYNLRVGSDDGDACLLRLRKSIRAKWRNLRRCR